MIDTHANYAYLLARSERLDEARAEFSKAVALARAVDPATFRSTADLQRLRCHNANYPRLKCRQNAWTCGPTL